ncbi:HAD-IIB family hydrolase [Thalassotalea mangrovi]|uniref:HAD-IIB family hydrolase n=1 Tax=Thalassotalea mangrovi TaxID=2572245 RepID=UPI00145F8216|nr:HAD-IIB family hydrolase [Thalassotalea mangrovi]
MEKDYIIATDLDGTLLDHHTYRFNKAMPALEYCDNAQVPIIFNTSKTFAETERLCKTLNNNHPFIIENGSALYVPKHYFARELEVNIPRFDAGAYWLYKFGLNRSEILSRLTTFKAQHTYQYWGFNSMSNRDLCRVTGLSLEQAASAQERQFSEPLLWQDKVEKLAAFVKHLQLFGLNVIKGGRFVHVLGQSNKAKPLTFLKEMYELNSDNQQTLIALGDSDNDKDMLNCADIAIVIASPVHENPIIEQHPHLIRSRYQGPDGWNDSILTLLQDNA